MTSPLRVVVLDDSPHVRWAGSVHAVNATFHRFLAELLDLHLADGAPVVTALTVCVPLRDAAEPPASLPLDERLDIVGTAPFAGLAGFYVRAPVLLARNAPRLRSALRGADVVLLRLPAANGLLAAALARLLGVPRLAYVVGTTSEVVESQRRPFPLALAAQAVARLHDGAARIAAIGARRIVVGEDLAGGGIVTSLVQPGEIAERGGAPWPAAPDRIRLAWAGRVADGKGLATALEAVAELAHGPNPASCELLLLGDGPARAGLELLAARLGVAELVTFAGHVADRTAYLAALRSADLFVFPSPAEGFPKVLLDAMAVGLPVIACPAGTVAGIAAAAPDDSHPVLAVPAGDPGALVTAVRSLVSNPARAVRMRRAGTAFARAHTAPAEAARLAAVLVDVARPRP